jgi:DNA polymerase III gamma/tau subunit
MPAEGIREALSQTPQEIEARMTPKEKKALTEALETLDLLKRYAGKFGGRENSTTFDLIRRCTAALNPESVGDLTAAVNAHAAVLTPFIEKGKQQAAAHEAEVRFAENEMRRVRDLAHAKQAAAVRERAEREQRAIAAAAVSEVL